jgi:hypothetical protein
LFTQQNTDIQLDFWLLTCARWDFRQRLAIKLTLELNISLSSNAKSNRNNVVSLTEIRHRPIPEDVKFDRPELDQLLRVYSFMVAGGEWRDYAIDHMPEKAVFSVFRRSSEMPLYRIEKDPKLARKQGAYAIIAASGMIVKRGQDLPTVLKHFDKAIKLVQSD